MPVSDLALLDSLSALADATRCRMLIVLERQELTVSELCAVVQLPQSTVSRQLKTLGDAGLVASRRDGTSHYYSLALGAVPHSQIWNLTRDQIKDRPSTTQDLRRLTRVLANRRETSEHFFASAAGQWDQLRADLFGREFSWQAFVGLLPDHWVVGDLGCGTGATMAQLAPHVSRVIGVDASDEMLAAASERLREASNVEMRRGSLESLPIGDASLDAATMILVLHHVPSPLDALAEAARVLNPGGRLLIVDMAPHEHEEYRQQMGHVWLGFSDEHLRRLMSQAGFSNVRIHPLPTSADATGPALVAVTGTCQPRT